MNFASWVPEDIRNRCCRLEERIKNKEVVDSDLSITVREELTTNESLSKPWKKLRGFFESDLKAFSWLSVTLEMALSPPYREKLSKTEYKEKTEAINAAIKKLTPLLHDLGYDRNITEWLPDYSLLCFVSLTTPHKIKLTPAPTLNDLLNDVSDRVVRSGELDRLVLHPGSATANKVYFVRFLYKSFITKFDQPMYLVIEKITNAIFPNPADEIDQEYVKNCIKRWHPKL